MRLGYDKSSKWLIQHHADAILRLGGVGQIKSWRALQAELVQPRKLPDGLLEVELPETPNSIFSYWSSRPIQKTASRTS